MKNHLLLPFRWKLPILVLLLASLGLFIAWAEYSFELGWLHFERRIYHDLNDMSNDNLTDELALTGIIGSLLALCFCRERVEDEYVRSIRLRSWQWAAIVNYGLLLIVLWTVFGVPFLGMLYYNMLTPVIIYLLIFYTRMHIIPRLSRRRNTVIL